MTSDASEGHMSHGLHTSVKACLLLQGVPGHGCVGTGIMVARKLLQKNDEMVKVVVADRAREFFGVDTKPLQINTVSNIRRVHNTFLLAGTGFGKSQIAEMYHILLAQKDKGVVVEKAGLFTVINLTKLTFNLAVAEEKNTGKYNICHTGLCR
ncbi:uncharacterized protein VP01_768g7 [Puccinia sorghi]|uniref:Uncharacterized protein n=1 Tax=Puccinia sorghi TaxID=27349 RepID=A0A0L6UBM4_9BASI|nr:uncharacterized protein VP01_768g7 [Puccinia sorghi]